MEQYRDELAEANREFGITVHDFEDLDLYDDLDDVATLARGARCGHFGIHGGGRDYGRRRDSNMGNQLATKFMEQYPFRSPRAFGDVFSVRLRRDLERGIRGHSREPTGSRRRKNLRGGRFPIERIVRIVMNLSKCAIPPWSAGPSNHSPMLIPS